MVVVFCGTARVGLPSIWGSVGPQAERLAAFAAVDPCGRGSGGPRGSPVGRAAMAATGLGPSTIGSALVSTLAVFVDSPRGCDDKGAEAVAQARPLTRIVGLARLGDSATVVTTIAVGFDVGGATGDGDVFTAETVVTVGETASRPNAKISS